MADLKKLAEDISKLSLVDAVELKNLLKDEYGIEPAAEEVTVSGAATGGAGGADGASGGDEKGIQRHSAAGDKRLMLLRKSGQ